MQMQEQIIEGFRLSPQQKQVWQLQQDGQAYNAQCAILIEGIFNSAALEEVLRKAMRKHEILRTVLDWFPGLETPIQSILDDPPLPYRKVDLSKIEPGEAEAAVDDLFKEESRPFDFKRGPLLRFCLARLSASRQVLLISLPSLCADSWTLKNLFKEIGRSYAAELEGKELSDEPVQYLQFSEWQNELLEERGDEANDRSQAVSSPVSSLVLPLEYNPAGGPESPRHQSSSESMAFMLDRQIARRIEAISNANRSSVSGFLLACWQILLWRLSGDEEIVTECLFDGRQFSELHEALGLFARYLPARGTYSHDLPFDRAVERAMKSLQQAYSAQRLFLREMANRKSADRAQAIGFEYEEWPETEYVGEVKFSYWKQYCYIDRFKLKLAGWRNGDGLRIELQYDPAFYSREGMELMGERYLRLVESAVEQEEGVIGDLEIVGEGELRRLLVEWKGRERRERESRCLHELIGEQARKRPESIAVDYEEQQLSYGELERRANRLAKELRRRGVGPERVVGLYLERSAEMMIGVLGILKAGGAYLPLEVGQPVRRVKEMLKDAGARVVVTKGEEMGRVLEGEWEVVEVEGESERRGGESEEELVVEVGKENLAYVIYTSGSTGKPKGVMVRHGSVMNLLEGLAEAIYEGEGEELRVSVNAPLVFDASVKQVMQLGRGRRICVVPEEERVDGERMVAYVKRKEIEVLDCTPSQLRVMMEAGLGKRGKHPRLVLVGGEKIDEENWRRMCENREVRYENVYGPTECTVDATVCEVRGRREVTIGRPINNTRIYILDERGRVLPIGMRGEIYIGGEGVSRGYVGDAGMTAERYVPDSHEKGERIYRTGDMGRYLEDGRIVYEGRRDGQVKVRGYRIEVGEIEEVLKSHAGVRDAVVIAREDEAWQKRLVGYVVERQRGGIEGKPRRRLPNGMAIAEQNRNETEYLYDEIFEKKSYFRHGIRLPEEGCVLDVGANIGLFTLFVARNRKGLRVYAFEPIEPIYETLKINMQLYGGPGVRLFKIGLGKEERREWYTYYRGYSMMSGESRYAAAAEDIEVIKRYLRNERSPDEIKELLEEADDILAHRFEEERYECEVRRLTDIIREEGIDRIDLLKVDVQRAEMDVLRGLAEGDWEKIDQIVMEVHDQEGDESEGRLEEIKSLLKEKGYTVAIEQDELLGGTDRYNLYAWRDSGVERMKEPEWVEIIVDEPWEEVTAEELRKYAKERLPDYMVPAAIVMMEELPLTRNGKVDRGALPRPEEVERQAAGEENGYRNEYEELIGGIWKEVLKRGQINRGDNFFDIGGHSLLATQVISQIRDVFRVEIGVRSIFEAPTIEGLGRRVSEAMRTEEKEDAPPLVRASREAGLPVSFAQQRLWFLDQLVPNDPFYNCPGAVRLEGRLDLEVLESAINEVVRRHEVLRTRIEIDEGRLEQAPVQVPVQVIDEWEPRRLEVEDLTNWPREEREAEVKRIMSEEAGMGFDLKRGPLIRVKVLKLGEEQHVLLYTMHHIVSDGWSMGILARELGALYRAYRAGKESPLNELPIQYADFAVWQREWLKGSRLELELEYWRQQLADMEDLELPTDHPRPTIRRYRGADRRLAFERELTERLRALSQRERATLFMTLLAGFDVVMSRYSGQEDVVLGTDIANRNRAEIEGLIGFFVNQLVLRVKVRSAESFSELLRQVREVCLGAYAHQDLPFEKLVEELRPERDLGRSPLFQTKLLVQNAPQEVLELEGLKMLSNGGDEVESARFDLTMVITDGGQDLIGVLNYSRDLFEEGTVERLMNHYMNVLRWVVEESGRPLSDLSLLSEAEREQIVVEWNRTERPYQADRLVHELFAEQADLAPERIALIGELEHVSYRELNRRSNQLAHYLQRLGVGPEVMVGLCLERSVEMVVAIMGVLKAGGAYLPLDPEYPLERLSYMLEDAGVAVVLTAQSLEERLPAYWGQIVSLDVEWERVGEESDGVPERGPESGVVASNLAYVIYTSGSTGRPKGVMIQHQGVCNLVEAQKRAFRLGRLGRSGELGDQSRVLQFASLSFDASVWEIFSTLATGGSLHVYGKKSLMPGDDLARVLKEDQITMVTLPPTVLAVLEAEELSHLQTVIAAGEACSAEIVDRWAGERRFFDAYGPTEATVCASMGECEAGRNRRPTIGRPIANARLYILDREMEPVPVGVPGELYISGAGLARGYRGRPDLTAERFIPDIFSNEGGGRLYRTEDLSRYLPDGEIEFLGRKDDQVKVRGYRIELGEIEAVLNEHRLVKQSVVVANDDERGGTRLIGYAVGEEGATAAELKMHLRERLPEYMVPESIMVLEEIPVTPNGKIDRRGLPSPSGTRRSIEEDLVAPRDLLELRLMKIWESVLGVEPIGVRDNFFDLGGHSLLAASLMSRIRKEMGRDLPLSALFQGGTIEHLAAILRRDAGSISWSCLVELQASGSKSPLFFVHPAGGGVLCYLELARCLGSDRPVYGLQMPGFYGERALYTRIEDIAAHYIEALRTAYPEGPYILGGWSSGGIFAYEMAQQLIAQGQRVSHLLLLDTTYRSISREEHIEHIEKKEDAILLMDLLAEVLPISKADLQQLAGDEQLNYVVKMAIDVNVLPPGIELSQARSFLDIFKTIARAVQKYVPRIYPGAVTLFRALEQAVIAPPGGSSESEQFTEIVQDPAKGWSELAAGGVRIIDVPGKHATIVNKPHVEVLASRINAYLDGAEAE